MLNYDYQRAPTPELKSELDWMVKQFGKLGVQLEIRATDYNQFQDKMLKGKQQIFWWGWLADYPDAENFLFLLYGPNAKYPNAGREHRQLRQPRVRPPLPRHADAGGRAREAEGDRPDGRRSCARTRPGPGATGPTSALAFQPWAHNGKPSILVRDLAKYYRVDPALRVAKQAEWNHPVRWPLAVIAAVLLLLRRAGLARLPRAPAGHREAEDGRRRRAVDRDLSMLNYLIRRLGYGVLILIGVNLFTFFLFFTVNTPDDMARLNIGGKRVTQEQIDKWKAERGYDKPLYWNAEGARARAKLTRHHRLGALGVAVRAASSAAPTRATRSTSATRSRRACG